MLGQGACRYFFGYKGGQYSIYDILQPFTTQITKDANPKIVDAPLTIIFNMGQRACHFVFALQQETILHL